MRIGSRSAKLATLFVAHASLVLASGAIEGRITQRDGSGVSGVVVVISDTSRNSTPLSRGILNQQSVIHVPTMEAKIEAHRLGLGIGYVPQDQVAEDLATGRLKMLTLAEPREDGPAMLGWKSSNRGQALHFMLDCLRGDRA